MTTPRRQRGDIAADVRIVAGIGGAAAGAAITGLLGEAVVRRGARVETNALVGGGALGLLGAATTV